MIKTFWVICLCILSISSVSLSCSAKLSKQKGESMPVAIKPLVVEFPVRGLWITPNSPGSKVPSHGTTSFGEAYAIDFVMINEKDSLKKFYDRSFIEYLLHGVPLDSCYGWGQEIFSPIQGEVIQVRNDVEERKIVHVVTDLQYRKKATEDFMRMKSGIESIAGNYILIRYSNDVYALLAHLKQYSILVKPGQNVKPGQIVGRLGHSGNSMAPHLHLQFMTSPNFKEAIGLPFVFKSYEIKYKTEWRKTYNSVPRTDEIIRY